MATLARFAERWRRFCRVWAQPLRGFASWTRAILKELTCLERAPGLSGAHLALGLAQSSVRVGREVRRIPGSVHDTQAVAPRIAAH